MITFYDFNALDESGKAGAVFTEGLFVDDRAEGEWKVQLYRLNNFYVEVFYDGKTNTIMQFRSFTSVRQLANYLRR